MAEQPKYLYKILPWKNWKESENETSVKLTDHDKSFIHFSTETQLSEIEKKHFANEKHYAVLTIEPELLEGNLVLEANPGGTTKYYHLYDGEIPIEAVIEAREVKK